MNLGPLTVQLEEHVDAVCTQLFELFCERRRIVPMAYLMHGWPLPQHTVSWVARLVDVLDELMQGHCAQLEGDERTLISVLLEAARREIRG